MHGAMDWVCGKGASFIYELESDRIVRTKGDLYIQPGRGDLPQNASTPKKSVVRQATQRTYAPLLLSRTPFSPTACGQVTG